MADEPLYSQVFRLQTQLSEANAVIKEMIKELGTFFGSIESSRAGDDSFLRNIMVLATLVRKLMKRESYKEGSEEKRRQQDGMKKIDEDGQQLTKQTEDALLRTQEEVQLQKDLRFAVEERFKEKFRVAEIIIKQKESSIQALTDEVAKLESKLKAVTDRLFSAPRVEEKILRHAKIELNKREKVIIEKESQWNRLDKSLKNVKIWKDKCAMLEETVNSQLVMIRSLEKQQNRAYVQYQRLAEEDRRKQSKSAGEGVKSPAVNLRPGSISVDRARSASAIPKLKGRNNGLSQWDGCEARQFTEARPSTSPNTAAGMTLLYSRNGYGGGLGISIADDSSALAQNRHFIDYDYSSKRDDDVDDGAYCNEVEEMDNNLMVAESALSRERMKSEFFVRLEQSKSSHAAAFKNKIAAARKPLGSRFI